MSAVRSPKIIDNRKTPTDRAIELIALAYGYGQCLDGMLDAYVAPAKRWTPTNPKTGEGDEENPAGSAGFHISVQSETLMQAGRAINPKDKHQVELFRKADPDKVKAAERWCEANPITQRGRGLPYRVGEFEHWKTITAVVMVPRARPSLRVMEALVDAELDGPLEHLLMFAATQDPRYWPKVKMHIAACGHPAWACDEAGLQIALGEWSTRRNWNDRYSDRPTRTQRVRSKALGMRAKDYAEGVRAAADRLEEWLQRAAVRVLSAMAPESNVRQNFGEPSAATAETWFYPKRYACASVRHLSAQQAESHYRALPSQRPVYPPAAILHAELRASARLTAAVEKEAQEVTRHA